MLKCSNIVSFSGGQGAKTSDPHIKLFRTYSNSVIDDCQHFFNFVSVDTLVRQRTIIFLNKICAVSLENMLINVFNAQRWLAFMHQAPFWMFLYLFACIFFISSYRFTVNKDVYIYRGSLARARHPCCLTSKTTRRSRPWLNGPVPAPLKWIPGKLKWLNRLRQCI